MSVQQLVLVASTVGAVLFALAGYVFRGMRSPSGGALAPQLPPGQLEGERRARSQAEQQLQQQRGQLEQRDKQLADVQRRYDELLSTVDQNPTQVTEPATPLSSASLQELEREGATLRQELQSERQARQQVERQLAEASKIAASSRGAKAAGGDAEQLRKKLRDEAERWNKERNDLRAKVNAAKTAQDKAQVQQEELRKHVETLRREQKQLRGKAEAAGGAAAQAGQLEQAEKRVRQLEAKLKDAEAKGKDQASLQNDVDQLRKQAAQADSEVKRQRQELEAAEREGKEQAEALRAKVAELEFKGEDTAASIKSLDDAQVETRELRKKLLVAEQKASSAEALRDEVVQLRASVEETGKQGAQLEELEDLRKKQRELQVKSQMLNQRVEQLQGYADENVTLRERVRSLEVIGESHGALQLRIKDLEAQLFASGGGETVEENKAVEARSMRASGTFTGTMAATLEGQLRRLSEDNQCRVAVLADSQGLLLAGSGETQYFEALAGVAGMIREMAQRTREFLPLGAPQIVQIADSNEVSLYARLLKLESELFALCTLGQRRGGSDPLIENVVEALPRVLAGSSSSES